VVGVDSSYDGYRPEVLTDGRINPANVDWTAVAWASADQPVEHWIELRFAKPTAVRRVTVWWAKDEGQFRESATTELQVPDGEGWRTVATGKPGGGKTVIACPGGPVPAIRLRQPPGGGSASRPNLLWVSELDVE